MTAVMSPAAASRQPALMSKAPTLDGHSDPFRWFLADHGRVLARLGQLEARLEAGEPVAAIGLEEFVAYLRHQFSTHMSAEENQLYPALADAFPESRPVLEPLLAEHAELRDMLASLASATEEPRSDGRDERVFVVMRDLIDLLRLHIRKEERAVFDVSRRVLSPDELDSLAIRIQPILESLPAPIGASHTKGTSQ
jgi:hemerythrin-like domain-containing protein